DSPIRAAVMQWSGGTPSVPGDGPTGTPLASGEHQLEVIDVGRMMDIQDGGGATGAGARGMGSLVRWLITQRLLRGPFLFMDYWANVLRLGGIVPERLIEYGLIQPALFRIGIDRPDLEVPRLRYYLFHFLAAPILIPFRAFRRLGRY